MPNKNRPIRRIVILGGGTAGWITANALVSRWGDKGVDIALVESPDIGTVGVGEGSTPRLKIFFDAIGVAESEWMPRCNATYKNGISFVDWSTREGFPRYFHPFRSIIDKHTSASFYFNTYARRQGADVYALPDRFFLAARLAEESLGPIPDENFPFVVEYGYHFDAHLVGEFLKELATGRGVRHMSARVNHVETNADGDISALQTADGGRIEGDFFVDCSGFRGTLIQETLRVPFLSFADNLFNDSAVVLPTEQGERIGSQTISTALKRGWAWEIPLTHRVGNGYVYSSGYCSADEAETELREKLGLLDSAVEARHLKMKVGRLEETWHRNCVAVGLSQGFIEPLEATALNIVCNTVYDFIDTVEDTGYSGRDGFNQRSAEGFEKIRDYIVAHYILNSREDTEYWRANGSNRNVPESLQRMLAIWKEGKFLGDEMKRQAIESSYTEMSWYCLFAGYGFFPPLRDSESTRKAAQRVNLREIDEFIRRCSLNFRAHRDQLNFD